MAAALLSVKWLYPVLFCSSVGVVTSFHTSLLLDGTAFARMQLSEELPSAAAFHVVNFLLHVLPVAVSAYLVVTTGQDVGVEHGCVHCAGRRPH